MDDKIIAKLTEEEIVEFEKMKRSTKLIDYLGFWQMIDKKYNLPVFTRIDDDFNLVVRMVRE